MKAKEVGLSLCHRCENRAGFLEAGHAPRYECGNGGSISSCYAYRPVKPPILRRDSGDRRLQFTGTAFAARSHAVRIPPLTARARRYQDGILVWWEPRTKGGA